MNTFQHLLAFENGVVLLGLEQKVQNMSASTTESVYHRKHDMTCHGGKNSMSIQEVKRMDTKNYQLVTRHKESNKFGQKMGANWEI